MRAFSRNQIQRFSNILDNAGQVVLASVVVQPIVSGSGLLSTLTFSGIIVALLTWGIAIIL